MLIYRDDVALVRSSFLHSSIIGLLVSSAFFTLILSLDSDGCFLYPFLFSGQDFCALIFRFQVEFHFPLFRRFFTEFRSLRQSIERYLSCKCLTMMLDFCSKVLTSNMKELVLLQHLPSCLLFSLGRPQYAPAGKSALPRFNCERLQ